MIWDTSSSLALIAGLIILFGYMVEDFE